MVNQLLLTSSSTTQLHSLLIKVGPAQARRKQLGSAAWERKEAELKKSLLGYGHFVGIITINDKMVTPISLLEWSFGGNHDVKDSPQKKQIWTKILQAVKLWQICQTSRQSTGATLIPPPLPPHCCVSLSQPPIPSFRCSSHWSTPLPDICLYSVHSSLLLCIHPHFLQWLLYEEEDFLYVVQLVLSLQDQEYGEGTGWFF